MIGILYLVIAVVILLMRGFIKPSKNEPIYYTGVGTIKKRIQEDCRINFYVEFRDQNGQFHVGRSITYKSTKGKYFEGDSANIKYYFSPKGHPLVVIDDNELVSCKEEAKPIATIMLVVALVFIMIGIISLISYFMA